MLFTSNIGTKKTVLLPILDLIGQANSIFLSSLDFFSIFKVAEAKVYQAAVNNFKLLPYTQSFSRFFSTHSHFANWKIFHFLKRQTYKATW